MMKNKEERSRDKAIAWIIGVTVGLSNLVNISIFDAEIPWSNVLIYSLIVSLVGILLGIFAEKMLTRTSLRRISVFVMSLGMAWAAIALFRLL